MIAKNYQLWKSDEPRPFCEVVHATVFVDRLVAFVPAYYPTLCLPVFNAFQDFIFVMCLVLCDY